VRALFAGGDCAVAAPTAIKLAGMNKEKRTLPIHDWNILGFPSVGKDHFQVKGIPMVIAWREKIG
jgi:hypothetical protein